MFALKSDRLLYTSMLYPLSLPGSVLADTQLTCQLLFPLAAKHPFDGLCLDLSPSLPISLMLKWFMPFIFLCQGKPEFVPKTQGNRSVTV